MEIGVISELCNEGRYFEYVRQFGLNVCQLVGWDISLAQGNVADNVIKTADRAGVRICGFWAGWPGPAEWNFKAGPTTLGLMPKRYRQKRIKVLKKWADFAQQVGSPSIITHCGFIPENITDPNYQQVVDAIKEVSEYCKRKKLEFWFETGQETPVVLLRTIERIGTDNLGINLDPANLLMYGKGNPIDALSVFGKYVRNIHIKDGLCPTDGENLGREVPVGSGMVRYPEFISKLKEIGFNKELIIEREIEGEQQIKDIQKTIKDLKKWLQKGER